MILSSPTFCFLKGEIFWGPFYKQGRVNGAVSLSLMNVWRNRPCWYKLFKKEPCRVLERAWELVYFDDTHKVTRKSLLIPLPVPLSCVGVLWEPGGGKYGIPSGWAFPASSRAAQVCESVPGQGAGAGGVQAGFPFAQEAMIKKAPVCQQRLPAVFPARLPPHWLIRWCHNLMFMT